MIERISQAFKPGELQQCLPFLSDSVSIPKHYNLPALSKVSIISNEDNKSIRKSIWGLLPQASKTGKNYGNLTNVRITMLPSAPSFRIPIRTQRCIVPADSYYVWQQKMGHAVPYRIYTEEHPALLLAGVWDIWKNAFETVHSFSIIHTRAHNRLRDITSWLPVVFNTTDAAEMWLEPRSLNEIMTLVRGQHIPALQSYRVSDSISSTEMDSVEVQKREHYVPTLFDQ